MNRFPSGAPHFRLSPWMAAGLTMGLATLAAGCGGKTDDVSEFIGLWELDQTLDANNMPPPSFQAVCSMLGTGDAPLFFTMRFERGTVSDLIDTAGCVMTYDVDGKSAKIQPTFPFAISTTMTQQLCDIPAGDGATFFEIEPTPGNWSFNLLAPVKGQAPRAQLTGAATMTVLQVDSTTNTVATVDVCSYTPRPANFTKVSK